MIQEETEFRGRQCMWKQVRNKSGKQGYEHFMLKEMEEQGEIVEKTLGVYVNEGRVDFEKQLEGFP